uniref:Retroviral aspartyl protease n=2 Tax=Candidatus Berkiella cookevillensis TaxID=437022 RepID=A0A0Q9YC56_9GAMM
MRYLNTSFIFFFLFYINTLQANTSTDAMQCINFPLTYSELSIPQTRLNINGKIIDFTVDLGMKTAFSLEETLVNELYGDQFQYENIIQSDLGGNINTIQKSVLPTVALNGKLFKNSSFTLYKPWGLWINADAQEHPMPNNTLGRDLFLKNKGTLYYSRNKKLLRWCDGGFNNIQDTTSQIIWMPLIEDQDGIHITAFYKDRPLNLVFDSAATVTLLKPLDRLNAEPQDTHTQDHSSSYLDTLKIDHASIHTLMYQHEFPSDFQADGLIGDSFFQDVDLIIDTINQKIGLVFL